NEADLDDVPESVLAELTVHLAKRIEEVLALALEPKETQAVEAA
ncbi:MAG TPA: S16 family serine protease, partial [Actinomycetota bacterium]|nr:S16 family serine protease [Actinomycetota bacterium]